MKRIRSHLLGIDQGEIALFADFEHGGEMWTGTGPRERRQQISFSEAFSSTPNVQTQITLLDADTTGAVRAEVSVENTTPEGCDLVFRTWGDSRFARIRLGWMAIGEVPDPEAWELY